jgi:hypothetical protein
MHGWFCVFFTSADLFLVHYLLSIDRKFEVTSGILGNNLKSRFQKPFNLSVAIYPVPSAPGRTHLYGEKRRARTFASIQEPSGENFVAPGCGRERKKKLYVYILY